MWDASKTSKRAFVVLLSGDSTSKGTRASPFTEVFWVRLFHGLARSSTLVHLSLVLPTSCLQMIRGAAIETAPRT